MPFAFLAPIFTALGTETGKVVIRWGAVIIALLIVIGIFISSSYYKNKAREEQETRIQIETLYQDLQTKIIIMDKNYEKDKQEWQLRFNELNKMSRYINQRKIDNYTLSKDIKKSLEQIQCQLDNYGITNGECIQGQFIIKQK